MAAAALPLPAGSADAPSITLRGVAVDAEDSSGTRRRILQETSLRIAGRHTAVIGANGSGKSTFLRVVAGLVTPSAGELSFTPRAPRTGFVFANPQAQIVMPVVGEDIEFSLRRSIRSARERRRRATEILTSLGLGDRVDSSVFDLSSGERQLVALAGVLAAEPELIVADEPTTLLDLRNASRFRRRLLALEAPLVYATHDLGFAAEAEHVIAFEAGRVIAAGDPGTTIQVYRELALSAE